MFRNDAITCFTAAVYPQSLLQTRNRWGSKTFWVKGHPTLRPHLSLGAQMRGATSNGEPPGGPLQ